MRPHVLVFLAGLALASPVAARAQEPQDTTANIPQPLLDQYATAVHENWVYFGGGGHEHYWFIPRTIKRTPRGTSTVWTVGIQSLDSTNTYTSAREAVIADRERNGQSSSEYANYLMTRTKWEIDCVHQRLRILRVLQYADDGSVIHQGDTHEKFEDPIPGTNGEHMLEVFCHPKKWRTFRQYLEPKP
ncbi:MAG TPA: surface-adhesin E family protein [Candidatus Acidoferrales bacterium]|nr:surface-adhesin E family protein [Candidatus Acidoferrales bacterium]